MPELPSRMQAPYGPFISRELAAEKGLKQYYIGRICKRSHLSAYRVNPNACQECLREGKRKPKPGAHICEQCRRKFYPARQNTRFCSILCNARFNNAKKSTKVAERNAEQELLKQWIPGYMPRAKAKELGLKTYFVAAKCPRGHVAPHDVSGGCTLCRLAASRDWIRAARIQNPEKYREIDRTRIRPRTIELRQKEAVKRTRRRLEIRCYSKIYRRSRRSRDPAYALRCDLNSLVGVAVRKQFGKKAYKTMNLIGCTVEHLLRHLESQFTSEMGWDNRGREGWHMDHIRPCNSFNLTDPAQQKACFYWANMRPLWGHENISKGDKWSMEDESQWIKIMRNSGYSGELFLVFH